MKLQHLLLPIYSDLGVIRMLGIIIVASLTVIFLLRHYSKVKSLPPGPFPFPLIGNVPQMALGLKKYGGIVPLFRKWQEDYGDVFTWWMGPSPAVNICDYDTSVEAMVKKGAAFESRPYFFGMNFIREDRGVIVSNGQHWTEQRKFSIHALKNLGQGKNLMQERIMLEFDYRTQKLDRQIQENGGSYSFDPWSFVELTVGNIINQMLFSQRFTENEETEFFRLKRAMDYMMENATIFDFMLNEWTTKIPPFKQRCRAFHKPMEDIIHFIKEQIANRKSEIASGKHELRDEGEDVVDAFLIEMKKNDAGSSFDDKTLPITLMDLWLAGQETTVTTLNWGIAYIVMHPEVKQKLSTELDLVTGRNRRLELADKLKTPYLNATITEILRMSMIVPVNLAREASEDIQIGNHFIPKGTAISAQLSVIMSNKKYFEEPEKFKPERFLQPGADQKVVAFGLGRRACLGEAMARAELYLILGNLFLTYDIHEDPAHPVSMKAKGEMGGMRRAQSYQIVVSNRI